MLTAAPNVDGVFLALKYAAPEDRVLEVQGPFEAVLDRLDRILVGRMSLGTATDPLHPVMFELRLQAVAAWAAAGGVDIEDRLERLTHELLEKATSAERSLLVRHMCFALDVQRELVHHLDELGVDLEHLDPDALGPLLKLDLDSFLELVRAQAPDPQAAVQMEKWVRASLRTELGMLMGDAVLNNEVHITAPRWYQVNAFLLNAAQELRAGAAWMSQMGSGV